MTKNDLKASNGVPPTFDRVRLRHHRAACARSFTDYNFLFQRGAAALLDRLADIRRNFSIAVDLGCHSGELAAALPPHSQISHLIQVDLALPMLLLAAQTQAQAANSPANRNLKKCRFSYLVADEERLPFAAGSIDLIISNLSLHWVNDLPGTLIQIRRSLRPDGLFLASLLGGRTLAELRECLLEAELAVAGGAGPRVSPMVEMADMGALLQRAGFALPVIDNETVTVAYPHLWQLLHDLRGMGESGTAVMRSSKPLNRRVIAEAERLYRQRFANRDGRLLASFEMIHLCGWAPHESQQKPLRPGSATHRLAEALETLSAKPQKTP